MAKQYSPEFKFQVAMEVLRDNKKPSQVAKAYVVHPNSVSKWAKTVLEEGPELFAKDGTVAEYERLSWPSNTSVRRSIAQDR